MKYLLMGLISFVVGLSFSLFKTHVKNKRLSIRAKNRRLMERGFSAKQIRTFRNIVPACEYYVNIKRNPNDFTAFGICQCHRIINKNKKVDMTLIRPSRTFLSEFFYKEYSNSPWWWPVCGVGVNQRAAYCKWVIRNFK